MTLAKTCRNQISLDVSVIIQPNLFLVQERVVILHTVSSVFCIVTSLWHSCLSIRKTQRDSSKLYFKRTIFLKQFQCLNIVLKNKTRRSFFKFSLRKIADLRNSPFKA